MTPRNASQWTSTGSASAPYGTDWHECSNSTSHARMSQVSSLNDPHHVYARVLENIYTSYFTHENGLYHSSLQYTNIWLLTLPMSVLHTAAYHVCIYVLLYVLHRRITYCILTRRTYAHKYMCIHTRHWANAGIQWYDKQWGSKDIRVVSLPTLLAKFTVMASRQIPKKLPTGQR